MSIVYERANGAVDYLNRHLDTNGDGTGSHDANVDGSGGSDVLFRIDPPADGAHVLHRLQIIVEGSGNFRTNTYGNLATLLNGLQVGYFDNSEDLDAVTVVDDLTAGHPVKSNFDWALHAHPVESYSWGGGNSHLVAVWDFARQGCPLLVRSGTPYAFGVNVRDNLSTLVAHEFVVCGYTTK